MSEYFIIRDANSRGDVATVWNWKRREWCWDLDGDYTAADGFAYVNKKTAQSRSEAVTAPTRNWYTVNQTKAKNVRVVDRHGLEIERERD